MKKTKYILLGLDGLLYAGSVLAVITKSRLAKVLLPVSFISLFLDGYACAVRGRRIR